MFTTVRFTSARLGLLPLLTLLLYLLCALPAHADRDPSKEVASQLEQAARLVEEGEVAAARRLLLSIERVHLEDGSEMPLSSKAWLQLIEEQPEAAAALLRATAQDLRHPRSELPANARERLEQVLDELNEPAEPSILQGWLETLLQESERIIFQFRWLFALIGGAMVSVVLLILSRGLKQHLIGEETLSEMEGELPLDAGEAQAWATTAAGSGDYREALRLLYLAALLHLDEAGLIRFDRALTNREVLASVSHDAPLQQLLAPVVTQFDRVWYGHAPFGQMEFENVRSQIEQLRTMERRT